MTVQITRQFRHQWEVFWATTYTFDPRMFEDFWLPRLGDAPLNVTLLVDFDRLSRTWDGIDVDRGWQLRRANRDYLIRGAHLTKGAFHPKTYFFANGHEGYLLVGSGNLTLGGVEKGHEVFCVFDSNEPEGLAAMQGWYEWMDRLVKRLNDHAVSLRWADVRTRTLWLRDAQVPSPFVSNWNRSLLDQLVDGQRAPVDELHLLAPFFDPHAQALARIIGVLEPRHIHVYVGNEVSVDGAKLATVLRRGDGIVTVHGFAPVEFVHAKLIGAVTGDHGRLLSGSANLSLAALTGTVAMGEGNVEAGVLLDTTAERVRSAFVPTRLDLVDKTLHDLTLLTFEVSERSSPYSHLLHSATRQPDKRVSVAWSGQDTGTDLYLCTGVGAWTIRGAETLDALPDDVGGQLAWLADGQDHRLSNAVSIDDPDCLARALRDRAAGPAVDRPRELAEQDLGTSVGTMLQRLHSACIFDVDETPAIKRARAAAEVTDDPDFWDRLAREELRLDPRASSYRQVGHHGYADSDGDGVLGLLQRMRDRIPTRLELRPVSGPAAETTLGASTENQPTSPQLQVRLFNVLDRWCQAVSDPRLRWLDPLAPMTNYTELLAALAQCWADGYFRASNGNVKVDRVANLLGILLAHGPF